jgi:hypothetical protein
MKQGWRYFAGVGLVAVKLAATPSADELRGDANDANIPSADQPATTQLTDSVAGSTDDSRAASSVVRIAQNPTPTPPPSPPPPPTASAVRIAQNPTPTPPPSPPPPPTASAVRIAQNPTPTPPPSPPPPPASSAV